MEWKEAPGYPSSRTCKRIPIAGPCSFLSHPSISSTVGIQSPAPIPKSHFHPHPAALEVQTLPCSRSPLGLPCLSCLPSTLRPLDFFHFFPLALSSRLEMRHFPNPRPCVGENEYICISIQLYGAFCDRNIEYCQVKKKKKLRKVQNVVKP